MLQKLKIANIALIDTLEVEFNSGLNVLTGETGAGKSIIIDSINFVLGARSDKTLIRNGESFARVEALFDVSKIKESLKPIFESFDIELDDDVLITRKMSLEGKNEIRVNGQTISSSMLREITSLLVDIYGQQEQVGFLKARNQLLLVDRFCDEKLTGTLSNYQTKLENLKQINNKLDEFGGDKEKLEREKDYLSFVIEEIENKKVSKAEEEDLINEKNKLNNAEKISSLVATSLSGISQFIEQLSQSNNSLINASQYDNYLVDLSNRLSSSKIEIEDINESLKEYQSKIDFNERHFNEIDNRLDEYKALKRKYGNTIEEVLMFLENSKQKLFEIENRQEIVDNLTKEKQKLLNELFILSDEITSIRKTQASSLCESIIKGLQDLGMKNARIEYIFSNKEKQEQNLTKLGLDDCEIYFSANLGEDVKQLNKVASGGELSRLMLAIKEVVSEIDDMPTMIFDEIDTGISGKMSQAVAEKIARISKHHQVLVVTHSPHIAAMADYNYLIEKMEENGKTISRLSLLNEQEKVEEIARFISTNATKEISLISAKALIDEQDNFKKSI